MKQGIVFQREAGTDTGFHGAELSFDEGRLLLALVRFWPGNAAAVRTRTPLPARQWVHVTVSYDGSGRAAGLHLFVNGKPAEMDVLRDKPDEERRGGRRHADVRRALPLDGAQGRVARRAAHLQPRPDGD